MITFDKLIRSSRFHFLLLGVATLVAICTLFWLALHELNSVRELQQIIGTDFKSFEREWSEDVPSKQSIPARIHSHLLHKAKTTQYILTIIPISVLFLALAWVFSFRLFRRLKNLKQNEQILEEFLYYDQVNRIHANTPISDTLTPAIKLIQLNRDAFIAELKLGLIHNQFVLHYQPIINADTGRITDVEALVRWQHPAHGLLPPAAFLTLSESNGFIIPLGEWVLQTACRQLRKWHAMGCTKLCLSVNLSARQFKHRELLTFITDLLHANDIEPACLKLEITESSLMRNTETSLKILKSLRHLGVQLALDDFGTGYSSLNYIRQFPVNNLKIDRSFIHDMTSNITSLAIVESTVALAKSLGLLVTAEGVENNTQLHMLKKMGCDLIQGYLFSKPVSADELTVQLQASGSQQAVVSPELSFNLSKYCYDILDNRHLDQAVRVFADTFCVHEPMTKYLGITPAEFTPFAKLIVEKAIRDELSIVALDNDRVIACTIVEDMADPLDISAEIDPRFRIIFSLLENLGENFFRERKISREHIAHLFITAVDPEYQGQGLSQKINFESIRLARGRGFDFMCCEFTHDYNEKGTVKHLKNSRLRIRSNSYKDFVFEGKKPFANLEGSANAYIWELREGAQLHYHINAET